MRDSADRTARRSGTARGLKSLPLIIIATIAMGVIYLLVVLGLRVNNGLVLAQDSEAFQLLQEDARFDILVVGDSTAVGTGAALASSSVAGRISQHYHCASVVNRGRDGATTRDVVVQLDGTANTGFGLVVVLVGANDVLRFTKLDDLRRAIVDALKRATAGGQHVVFINSGHVSDAPMLVPPWDWIYARRSREAGQVLAAAAKTASVEYVDLSTEQVARAMARAPENYYAADGLHPGDAGYRLWYRALMRQSRIGSLFEC